MRFDVKESKLVKMIPAYELIDHVSGLSATIVPSLGGRLMELRYSVSKDEVIDFLRRPGKIADLDNNLQKYGCPILMPPNRIMGSSFTVKAREDYVQIKDDTDEKVLPEEKSYFFPAPADEHYRHGELRDLQWNIKDTECTDSSASITLSISSKNSPLLKKIWQQNFSIDITYALTSDDLNLDDKNSDTNSYFDSALKISATCLCEDESKMLPFGFGFHPYFNMPLTGIGTSKACFIKLPTDRIWKQKFKFPTGETTAAKSELDFSDWRSPEGVVLDDLYRIIANAENPPQNVSNKAHYEDRNAKYGLTIDGGSYFPFWVLYNGEPGTICIEPYTCVTDAFNLVNRSKKEPREVGARLIDNRHAFTVELAFHPYSILKIRI